MATAYISTTTELTLLNTLTRPGVIILPSTTSVPGRILTFKDTRGSFGVSSITFSTVVASEFLENNTRQITYTDPFGAYSFIAGTDNKWYTIGGTRMFSAVISSITTLLLNTFNISSANITTSTLQFRDSITTSTTTLFSLSTNVYYSTVLNNFIVGPTKAPKALFTPIRAPFLPSQIANLSLWLDATNSNTIVGNPDVNRWLDLSPTNKTVAQSPTVNVNPTYTGNGVNFSNTNSLFVPTLMPVVPYDFFIVGSPIPSNAGYRTFLRTQSAPGVHPILTNAGTNSVGMWNGASFQQFGSYTWTGSELAMFYVKATAGVVCQASKNGDINLTAPTTASVAESQITCIGNSVAGGQPGGIVNEFILYSAALTTTQRQQVEGYLAWKWGLVGSLPAVHPYKNSPP